MKVSGVFIMLEFGSLGIMEIYVNILLCMNILCSLFVINKL
jgi:hypothetical protein